MKMVLAIFILLSLQTTYAQDCLTSLKSDLSELSRFSPDKVSNILINENCDLIIKKGIREFEYFFNLSRMTLPESPVLDNDYNFVVKLICNGLDCVTIGKKQDNIFEITFVSEESGNQFISYLNNLQECCNQY